jgi:hypothetical protein
MKKTVIGKVIANTGAKALVLTSDDQLGEVRRGVTPGYQGMLPDEFLDTLRVGDRLLIEDRGKTLRCVGRA